MPKPKKPKKIIVEMFVFVPRVTGADMVVEVEIDPESLSLSDQPTAAEVAKVAEEQVLDKLKFKLASGHGRAALKEIKAYRKAKEAAGEAEEAAGG